MLEKGVKGKHMFILNTLERSGEPMTTQGRVARDLTKAIKEKWDAFSSLVICMV